MNARRLTGQAFMKSHDGHLDMAFGEAYLSDHGDSFEKKKDPDQRSLCGHEEMSPVGEPVWGNPPYSPSGAVTGEVTDAAMAEQMTMIVRAGHPCGEDFSAAPFLRAHPEFAWQKPILHDMKAGPWTEFKAGESAPPGAGQAASGR